MIPNQHNQPCKDTQEGLPGVVLYQPEIAGNTGTLVRLSACWGTQLHLIHPLGFVWSGPHLRRAGLDYHDRAQVRHHEDWPRFIEEAASARHRCVAVTPRQGTCYWDFDFTSNDLLVLGSEHKGLPQTVVQDCQACVHIPMLPQARSLNLALAAGLVLGQALLNFWPRPPLTEQAFTPHGPQEAKKEWAQKEQTQEEPDKTWAVRAEKTV